ncbi:MAG TPA: hypothetical protein V6C52_15025 [Coleofasciculaceae cyanobacterium]|jgi:hypothetical protein
MLSISNGYPSQAIHFAGRKTKGILYSAMFLSQTAKESLLNQVNIPAGWKSYASHCTIEFVPPGKQFPTGSGTLLVREIRKTPEVIYAVVEPPDDIRQWIRTKNLPEPPWHITIATAPGIPPIRAKKAAETNEGVRLSGFTPPLSLAYEAGGFNGREVVHSIC